MDAKQLFIKCLESATAAVLMVKAEDYPSPTPDTEWDVKTLASHMLNELSWTADIVNGKTIAEVGDKYDGNLIGSNLQTSWLNARDLALAALASSDPKAKVHLSWGSFPAEFYLKQAASDQLIHSWDLSTALGEPTKFNDKIAKIVYDNVYKRRGQLYKSGLFAPVVDVPKSADLQTRLLAIYGRDARQAEKFKSS